MKKRTILRFRRAANKAQLTQPDTIKRLAYAENVIQCPNGSMEKRYFHGRKGVLY